MFILLAITSGLACTTTVPEALYQADLQAQQTAYERRLRRLQETSENEALDHERKRQDLLMQRNLLSKRIGRLELQLSLIHI